MIKVEFGMVKDKPWLYYGQDGENEPTTVFVTEVYGKQVRLSNGDTVSTDSFYELCEPALDEEPMMAEEMGGDMLLEGLVDTGQKPGDDIISEVMNGIQFDSNGVPIMAHQGPVTPQQPKALAQQPKALAQQNQPKTYDSPLITLTEKGQTKLAKINFQLDFPTVNKTLFNALMETYPEEEIDMLLEHMIGKVGIDNIKAIIKQRVLQHYKPSKKDVAL